MYETNELGSMSPASAGSGRVFFSISYVNTTTVPDAAFKRAASTWRTSISRLEGFRSDVDVFVEEEVRTEPQFRAAWNGVAHQAALNDLPVWVGNVLSHASKDSRADGLEFSSVNGDGTISQSDIKALAQMPWDKNGYLLLSGCNTGLLGARRTWCPAQEFAQAQRVRTLGQAGYAYFSSNWDSYTQTTPSNTSIALWAYSRGKNAALGSGMRMRGKVFEP